MKHPIFFKIRPPAARLVRQAFPFWSMVLGGVTLWSAAQAQPAIFKDADLGLGAKLIAEHKCSECHVRRVGGDGSAIFRPAGRVNSPGALRGMVEQCNTELRLSLFPEEVEAMAAVLNRDHYKFK